MKYLSVCSGIEAATVAWHPLGWKPEAFSEIEKFPSRVLSHHYPDVPNLGDMTKYQEWNLGTVDLVVGGTPCQSFSVAGLRKGLADPRGNLALVYCGILDRFKPKWCVWENVPGVLSSNGGRDFGSFLGALAELGYGFAYRVLDAQYFGVAQRRRRVFVVGYLGDWRRAASVLFEPESLRRNSPPSREKRKVTPILSSSGTGVSRVGLNCEDQWFIEASVPSRMVAFGEYVDDDTASAMKARDYKDATDLVAHTLRGEGFDASEDGTGRGTPLVPVGITIHGTDGTASVASLTDISSSLRARIPSGVENSTTTAVLQPINIYGGNKRPDRPEGGFYVRMGESTSKTLDAASGLNPTCSQGGTAVMQPIAFEPGKLKRLGYGDAQLGLAPTLRADAGDSQLAVALPIGANDNAKAAVAFTTKLHNTQSNQAGKVYEEYATSLDRSSPPPALLTAMQVRRLTPVECERLQGFPDNYTNIPKAADGPRYKALGNSMAVPVMAWIGRRIQQMDAIHSSATTDYRVDE
jgi:DNA (cytosine-5)-methyltransferase 1